jgi:hypothetical protein
MKNKRKLRNIKDEKIYTGCPRTSSLEKKGCIWVNVTI